MPPKELKARLRIFWNVILALLVILVLKLGYVQFIEGEKYETQAKENRIRLVAIKAPRGEIYDRKGRVLAANKRVYSVTITYLDMKDQQKVASTLAELLQPGYPQVTASYINFLIEKQKARLYEPITVVRDIDWPTVVRLEEHRQELPGVQVEVEPVRYYPEGILAGHVLGYVRGIPDQETLERYYDPVKYRVGDLAGRNGLELVYEKYLKGKDGARRVEVDVRGRPVRQLVTLQPKAGNNLVLTIDRDLQAVMDQSLDQVLASLQKKDPRARVAACVLMDVRTGAVLAMSSRPALNPNDFTKIMDKKSIEYYFPSGGKYDPLNPGAENNRVIRGLYAPGSTFKPVTAMAALESGRVDPENDYVNCTGAYWIKPYIKCWDRHGPVNLYTAMAKSCNTYFQEAGRRAGKDLIIKVAREFGLGEKTGIDLPWEKKGLVPSPEYKKEVLGKWVNDRYEKKKRQLQERYQALLAAAVTQEEEEKIKKDRDKALAKLEAQYKIDYRFNTTWQPYDTFNMSIGQGYNQYTVMELACYVGQIANGGKRMKPYLVEKVVSQSGQVIKEFHPQVVHQAKVSPETIEEVKKAMHAVVLPGGTGYYIFSGIPQEISGGAKTGTAQFGGGGNKDFHGVFVAFAPYENPEVVFAGIVEYGYHGSSSAGLVAKAVLEQYFGVRDYLVQEPTLPTEGELYETE